MELFKYSELLLNSEPKSRRYLSGKCWQNKIRFCIRCRSEKIYRLADKRYRCSRCGYTFQEFAGRWIAALKITAAQWLWMLKLFELEIPPNRIAIELGISYPTVLKAMRLLRYAILQKYLAGQSTNAEGFWHRVLADFHRKRPEYSGKNTPVFSIEERNGTIEVAPAYDLAPATLRKSGTAMTKLGRVYYAKPRDKRHALVFWSGGRSTQAQEHLSSKRSSPKTDLVEDFLAFATDRLGRLPRISARQLPLDLMEMKFRYDHRGHDQFELLAGAIAQIVPSHLNQA